MWCQLGINDFVWKKYRTDEVFIIYVANFKNIWWKSMTNNELISTCQEHNPLFEAEESILLEKTLYLFDEQCSTQKDLQEEESDVIINFKTSLMGRSFKFKIRLQLGDQEMFYKELMVPLLVMVKELQNRENKLIKIINEKDVEIEEYKSEGIKIKRTHVITERFLENDFKDQMLPESMVLELSKNPSTVINEQGQHLLQKIPVLKVKVKDEGTTQEGIQAEILVQDKVKNEPLPGKSQCSKKEQKKIGPLRVEINHDIKKRKVTNQLRLNL